MGWGDNAPVTPLCLGMEWDTAVAMWMAHFGVVAAPKSCRRLHPARPCHGLLACAPRCCVQLGPGPPCAPFVAVDAVAHTHLDVRTTLHVQSMSKWAPQCIGPYCQANVVRSLNGAHFAHCCCIVALRCARWSWLAGRGRVGVGQGGCGPVALCFVHALFQGQRRRRVGM